MGAPKKDKKNAMVVLIEKGEDGIHETTNILARVWRIVLYRYNLSGHKWQSQITRYQERINKVSTRKGSANMKGNLIRRLAEDRLSWGSLMRGFSILEFDLIEITFRFTKRKDVKEFTIVMNNDELDSYNTENEDNDN